MADVAALTPWANFCVRNGNRRSCCIAEVGSTGRRLDRCPHGHFVLIIPEPRHANLVRERPALGDLTISSAQEKSQRREESAMAVARRTVLQGMLITGASLATLKMPAAAAPEGTMTWGVHITLASRWLDPAETEGIITPF